VPNRLFISLGFVFCSIVSLAAQETWYPYPVEVWEPPFNMDSPRSQQDYMPLEQTDKEWNIVVFFPHMKDSYWLAVNYGISAEAKRLGIHMTLLQAGGYDHLDVQIAQIHNRLEEGVDGIIIGAISFTGLDSVVANARARGIPVVDVINGMSSPALSAKSLVSFGEMGYKTGEYIAQRHPKGTPTAKVAWFPGPKEAGWVQVGDEGFRRAVAGGAIEIVATRYGDTDKTTQGKLVEQVLDEYPDLDYIIGTAVTAEASVRILRKRQLDEKIGIMSYYFTPGIHRGIKRGKIIGAPTDSAVIQGRIAIDQITRILDGQPYLRHVGPLLHIIDAANIDTFDQSTSLAPSGFRAVYTVN
jgi:protein TorT